MPVLLTTPFDPGDLDPGHTYLRAAITDYVTALHSEGASPQIMVYYTFGDIVEGQFVKGGVAPARSVSISGSDYATIIASLATEEEDYSLYEGVKRVLYTYLIDNGYLVGTIE